MRSNCRLWEEVQWHPTPVFSPGKSHGWRSLVGYSPGGCEETDTTGWLHFHFSLSWIGEGNGNPLQCSCLENPRDGGAWQAAIYGVTQNRTWLKWFSSSKLEQGNICNWTDSTLHTTGPDTFLDILEDLLSRRLDWSRKTEESQEHSSHYNHIYILPASYKSSLYYFFNFYFIFTF